MTEQAQAPAADEQAPALPELLKKGLEALNHVTNQGVTVNKMQMIDLLNFEVAVRQVLTMLQPAQASGEQKPA